MSAYCMYLEAHSRTNEDETFHADSYLRITDYFWIVGMTHKYICKSRVDCNLPPVMVSNVKL